MSNSSINIQTTEFKGYNLGSGTTIYDSVNPFNQLNFKSLVGAGTISLISGSSVIIISGSSVPAGSDSEILFNDAGSVGSNSGFTFSASTEMLSVPNIIISTTPTGITSITDQILVRNGLTGIVDRASEAGLVLPLGTTGQRLIYPGISGTIRFNDDFGLVEVNTPYVTLTTDGYEIIGNPNISSVEFNGNWAGGAGLLQLQSNLNAMQSEDTVTEWKTLFIAYDPTNDYTKSTEVIAIYYNDFTGGTSTLIGTEQVIYDVTDDPSPIIITLKASGGTPEVEVTQTGSVVRNYDYHVINKFTFNKPRKFK